MISGGFDFFSGLSAIFFEIYSGYLRNKRAADSLYVFFCLLLRYAKPFWMVFNIIIIIIIIIIFILDVCT